MTAVARCLSLRVPQVVLGQTVVSRLPDVVRLGSGAEAATEEMRRLLLLVLGCAVQCSCKQKVVDNIKLMDYQTQHAIVECIQQVSPGYYVIITPFGMLFTAVFTAGRLEHNTSVRRRQN